MMLLTTVLWAQLFQADPVRRLEALTEQNTARAEAMTEPQRRVAELKQRLLEERYRKLVESLERFTGEYNRWHGNVWPTKEAEALRKACHDLERAILSQQPKAHSGPEESDPE
jgi:uncharacterized protein involved in tolerance to divalent cations